RGERLGAGPQGDSLFGEDCQRRFRRPVPRDLLRAGRGHQDIAQRHGREPAVCGIPAGDRHHAQGSPPKRGAVHRGLHAQAQPVHRVRVHAARLGVRARAPRRAPARVGGDQAGAGGVPRHGLPAPAQDRAPRPQGGQPFAGRPRRAEDRRLWRGPRARLVGRHDRRDGNVPMDGARGDRARTLRRRRRRLQLRRRALGAPHRPRALRRPLAAAGR
ncbi:hypothetical protein H632_c5045p0, partial [Helicosporidium sp. ATCC 50920]